MTADLTLACTPSTPIVPNSGQPRLVYVLVEVGGGEGTNALPVNLGLVIDSSESMRIRLVTDDEFAQLAKYGNAQEVMTDGIPAYQVTSIPPEVLSRYPRRIDYVAEALIIASEFLRPIDSFSVVAFAREAVTLIPTSSGRDRAKLHQSSRDLEHLNLGDETHMDKGLALALDEMHRTSGSNGIPIPKGAGRLIVLTDGHTRNVSECYTRAKKAREDGLTLSTMGIGSEFNEELLIPLADLTGGNAYYIETPDRIPAAFRKELGAALRVSYRNVDVKLQLPAGVSLRRAHRVLPQLGDFDTGPDLGESYALLLGNYDPTEPQAVLLELVTPAWGPGNYRLMQLVLSWEDPAGGLARPHIRHDIVIQVVPDGAPVLNQRVMNIVEKVGAFRFGTQALEMARQGDRGAATVRLRQAATRLLDMGERNLAEAMQNQADALESNGQLDPNITKKLRYETRRIVGNTKPLPDEKGR
jgi:Ca-activated chloride channel homolog